MTEKPDLWTRAYGGTLIHAWNRVGSKPGFGSIYRALCNPNLRIGNRGTFNHDKKCPKCATKRDLIDGLQ